VTLPPRSRGEFGFALALALLLILVGTSLTGIAAFLAIGELRWSVHSHRRVTAGLAARQGAALPWIASSFRDPSAGPQVIQLEGGPEGATAHREVEWLAPDLALASVEARAGEVGPARTLRSLRWRFSTEAMVDLPGTALSAAEVAWVDGADAESPWASIESMDGCVISPQLSPAIGGLPLRWNRPLDLAVGWRPELAHGGTPLDSGSVAELRSLQGPGLVVMVPPEGESASLGTGGSEEGSGGESVPGPGSPILGLFIVAGDLRIEASARVAGILLVGGDLFLADGAGLAGVARVGGRLTASPGQLSGNRCVARLALRRTHLWDLLLEMPRQGWILP
jgi:hypothetical protein